MVNFSTLLENAVLLFNSETALNVLFLAIVLAVISLFIWEFYKSTSKRNLIELNLNKYNYSSHPFLKKFFAVVLYFVEYIIIMPFIITLWFAALSFVLFLIAEEGASVQQVLLIAAVLIGAIRILAYFKSEISKDLAKLFPFIALAVFLLSFGNLFSFDRFIRQIREVPLFLNDIFSFVLVIFFIEIVLRVIYTVFDFWMNENVEEDAIERVVKEKVKEVLEE